MDLLIILFVIIFGGTLSLAVCGIIEMHCREAGIRCCPKKNNNIKQTHEQPQTNTNTEVTHNDEDMIELDNV